MKVIQLRELLKDMPQGGRVYFSGEWGDLHKIYTVTEDADGDTVFNDDGEND